MTDRIKALLAEKRAIDTECQDLHGILDNASSASDERLLSRMNKIDNQLFIINSWLKILKEDEAFVVKRHLIDGIDYPRIAMEFEAKWGYVKSERTIKFYQKQALAKIAKYVEKQKMILGDEFDISIPN